MHRQRIDPALYFPHAREPNRLSFYFNETLYHNTRTRDNNEHYLVAFHVLGSMGTPAARSKIYVDTPRIQHHGHPDPHRISDLALALDNGILFPVR